MRYLPILLPIFLAACGANTLLGNVSTQINTVTVADLKNAIVMANAAVPPDTEAVTCFTWMEGQLPTIQAALTPANPASVGGVFSAFEAAHIGVNVEQGGLPASLKQGFDTSCGPYVANVIGGINGLMMQVGGLGGIKL